MLSNDISAFFDTSNVTTMYLMFSFCTNLKTIPQFNTSKCTDFYGMLNAMPLLESIPKLDYSNAKTMQIFIGTNNEAYWPLKLESLPDISTLTTKLTNCASAFKNARNVKYGILDAYNKLVSCNPTTYTDCFLNCGINTEEGRAQLEQIPASWGGLAT